MTTVTTVVGCARQQADLLQVTSVDNTEVRAGTELRIAGRGFPVGHLGTLSLVGHTHRPGQAPHVVQLDVRARAVTETRAVARITHPQFERLGGHGTFAGSGRLSFTSNDQAVEVGGGVTNVQLDLVASGERWLPKSALRQDARKLLGHLGITVDLGASSLDGVQVADTLADSPAAAAGLAPGDLIIEASHVKVHSISDLAPPPGISELKLRVRRPHRTHPVSIRLPLSGLGVPALSRSWAPAAALAVALLWFVAFYGPFHSPSLWVARVQSRIRHGNLLQGIALWDEPRTGPLGPVSSIAAVDPSGQPEAATTGPGARATLRRAWPLVLAGTALFFGAYAESKLRLSFNSLQFYLGTSAILVWLSLYNGGTSWRARFRNVGKPVGQLIIMMTIIGCACALSGTRSLSGIVASQGGLPTRWGMFCQPALFLLFPVFVMVESTPPRLNLGTGPMARVLTRVAFGAGRVVICGMGAAVFLGGWAHHEWTFLPAPQAQALGAALFTAKSFFLALILHAARMLSIGRHRSRLFLPAMVGGAVCIALLWVMTGAGAELQVFFGTVLASSAALVTVTAGLKVLLSDTPMSATPQHANPFR